MIKDARFLLEGRICLQLIYKDGQAPMELVQKLAVRGIVSTVPIWDSHKQPDSDGDIVIIASLYFPDGEDGRILTNDEYRDLRRYVISCLRADGYKKKLNSIKPEIQIQQVEIPIYPEDSPVHPLGGYMTRDVGASASARMQQALYGFRSSEITISETLTIPQAPGVPIAPSRRRR